MKKKDEATLIDALRTSKKRRTSTVPSRWGARDVLTQIAKTYGSADNFDVIINVDKGDCEIYQNFDIVEEVENPNTQITLEQIKRETGETTTKSGTSSPRNCHSSPSGAGES